MALTSGLGTVFDDFVLTGFGVVGGEGGWMNEAHN